MRSERGLGSLEKPRCHQKNVIPAITDYIIARGNLKSRARIQVTAEQGLEPHNMVAAVCRNPEELTCGKHDTINLCWG